MVRVKPRGRPSLDDDSEDGDGYEDDFGIYGLMGTEQHYAVAAEAAAGAAPFDAADEVPIYGAGYDTQVPGPSQQHPRQPPLQQEQEQQEPEQQQQQGLAAMGLQESTLPPWETSQHTRPDQPLQEQQRQELDAMMQDIQQQQQQEQQYSPQRQDSFGFGLLTGGNSAAARTTAADSTAAAAAAAGAAIGRKRSRKQSRPISAAAEFDEMGAAAAGGGGDGGVQGRPGKRTRGIAGVSCDERVWDWASEDGQEGQEEPEGGFDYD